MAGVGLAGICKDLYNNQPTLQALVPNLQAFLHLGKTVSETQGDLPTASSSFSVPILLPAPPSCANNDDIQRNDSELTGSDVTTIIL